MTTQQKSRTASLSFAFILILATITSMGCESRERMKIPFSAEGLRYASRDGRLERVQKAIDSGTDVNVADPNGATALLLAAFSGHTEVVQLLLKNGAEVDHADNDGRTALMYAASDENLDTLKALLEAEIDIDATEKTEGFTALMYAAAEGQVEATRLLLEAKANTTLTDKDGDTAESFALKAGHQEVVDLFQTENSDLKQKPLQDDESPETASSKQK